MPGLFVVTLLIVIFLLGVWWKNRAWDHGAPYVEMEPGVVERVMRIARVGKGDVFYDLGSGDGRLVIAAALKGAKAYGVETDNLRVLYSRLWIKILRLEKKAKIIHDNIFKTKISNATVVCIYLLPETNKKLKKVLKKKLKKGTKVVSVGFRIAGWKPKLIDPRGTIYGPIRLYVI